MSGFTMKNLKDILKKIVLLSIVVFILPSCQDFLVEEPETQISTDQFFTSPQDARSSVNSLYDRGVPSLYGDIGGNRGDGIRMGGYMAGLFNNQNKGEAPSVQHAHNLSLNGTNLNQFLHDIWSRVYNAIAGANTAIKKIPNIEALSPAESNRLIAEARFFRALNYFYLVKSFGDVPLVTEPYEGLNNLFVGRDGEETVYDQIVNDLNWALDQGGLSSSPFPMNDFRITEGAVASLLADVHLQMAGHPMQADGNYSLATDAARIVINSGDYELIQHGSTLEESAYNIWRTSDVEREYVYAVEFNKDLKPNGTPRFAIPNDVSLPNIKYGRTLAGYFPIQEFTRVYDPNKDLRIQNQQLFYDEIVINGTTFTFDEKVPYLYHDSQALFETGRGDMDIRVYRYSEVLLIAAEAIARSEGVTSEAITYLADVRDRAYWQTDRSEIVSNLNGLSVQEFVEEVWKERLRELALNYKIWSDIQRTRKYPVTSEGNIGEVNFVDVVGQSNNWGETFEEHHLLYPIPEIALQRNLELEQNPGY